MRIYIPTIQLYGQCMFLLLFYFCYQFCFCVQVLFFLIYLPKYKTNFPKPFFLHFHFTSHKMLLAAIFFCYTFFNTICLFKYFLFHWIYHNILVYRNEIGHFFICCWLPISANLPSLKKTRTFRMKKLNHIRIWRKH